MKNISRYLAITLIVIFSGATLVAQHPAKAVAVSGVPEYGHTWSGLFEPHTGALPRHTRLTESVQQYQLWQLNMTVLAEIQRFVPNRMSLHIQQADGKNVIFDLQKNETLSAMHQIRTLPADVEVEVKPGLHYQGYIRGEAKSMVAISFFDNEVSVVAADAQGNFTVAPLKTTEDTFTGLYVSYRDHDLLVDIPFNCQTTENDSTPSPSKAKPFGASSIQSQRCPKVYFEADYSVYSLLGSNLQATANRIAQWFNVVQAIYAIDNINIGMVNSAIWTSQTTYDISGDRKSLLSHFTNYRNGSFYGADLAMLLAHNGGVYGLATGNGKLCTSNATCFGMILNENQGFPLYSFSALVIAHEMGHIVGSHHTHWCGWPNGPIDNCGGLLFGAPEPSSTFPYICAAGPTPSLNNGTIMSYCHEIATVGINFSLGFGVFPAAAIADHIDNAGCVAICGVSVPPTDDPCSATIITAYSTSTCQSATQGSVTNATSSGLSIPACSNNPQSATARDVFFAFDAVSNQHKVTMNPIGSDMDGVMAFYKNNCGSLSFIGCVDPTGGQNGATVEALISGLIIGERYYIRLFDWGQTQPVNGDFTICVTTPSVPSQSPNLTHKTNSESLNLSGTTTIVLNHAVINNGNAYAGASQLQYWLSASSDFKNLEYNIGDTAFTDLNAGWSYTTWSSAMHVSTMGIPAGTYYFGFYIDAKGQVQESNEMDNIWYFPNNPITVTPTIRYFQLQTNVYPSGAGFASGGGVHQGDAGYTINVTPYSGYKFLYWFDDFEGEFYSYNPQEWVYLGENRSLTAIFAPNTATDPAYGETIQLSPNPLRQGAMLHLQSKGIIQQIEVIDMAGRMVMSPVITELADHHTFPCLLAQGHYHIRVKTNAGVSVGRIVVL